jgi:hypothetical protein
MVDGIQVHKVVAVSQLKYILLSALATLGAHSLYYCLHWLQVEPLTHRVRRDDHLQ